MAFIQKQDTNGTKAVLLKGELGYDDYTVGGDTGRVYVGNGTTNEALSKKAETDLLAPKANPIFTGLLTEQVSVSTLTLGATSSVQTYTATGNFTIIDDLVSGESVTLILTNGGFTPTYGTTTWWDNADGTTAPTLQTTDKIKFEKVGAVLYGSHIGSIL
jgi:hypothetical protein